MRILQYEVTSISDNNTRTKTYEAVRVMINSNNRRRMIENFKKLDDLQINDSIPMTDNYSGMGNIIIERVS